jgi:hypothetical protein
VISRVQGALQRLAAGDHSQLSTDADQLAGRSTGLVAHPTPTRLRT